MSKRQKKTPDRAKSGVTTEMNNVEDYLNLLGRDSATSLRAYKDGRAINLAVGDAVGAGWNVAYPINGWEEPLCDWLVAEDDSDKTLEEKTLAWQCIGIEPTFQVFSGNKSIHNYWRLASPVAPSVWQDLQSRLAITLKSDTSLSDLGQLMRVPGYLHPRGTLCVVINSNDKTYPVDVFEGVLDPLPARRASKARSDLTLDSTALDALRYLGEYWGPYTPGKGEYPDRMRIAAILTRVSDGLDLWMAAFGDEGLGRPNADSLFRSLKESAYPATPATLIWIAQLNGWVAKVRHEGSLLTPICDTDDKGKLRLPTDTKAADHLASQWQDKYRWSGSVYRWGGTHWTLDERQLRNDITDQVIGLGGTVRYIDNIERQITTRLLELTETEDILAFQNGCLIDGKFISHKPGNFNRHVLPFDYAPKAKCPRILEWIEWIKPGNTKPLLAVLRCALLGRPATTAVFAEVTGVSNSGKSTFANFCRALAGLDYVHETDPQRLEKGRFEISALIGKKLIVLNDIARYGGEVSVLKALTAGDRLTAEFKQSNQRKYLNFRGLVLVVGEHTLKTSDLQSGIDRRRFQIHFERRAENPRQLLDIINQTLVGELAPEISGLINVLLEMSDSECAQILANPQSVNSEEYRLEQLAEQNSIAGFLLNKCRPGEGIVPMGNGLSGVSLYQSYLIFCEEQKIMPLTLTRFGRDLNDVANNILKWPIVKCKTSKGIGYSGIELI